MNRLLEWVLGVYRLLEKLEGLPKLLARVGVGLMFFGGALHKATHLSEFVTYFESLHIPFAAQQAPFVVAVEMFGGLGLMLGLGTRIAALMLSGTMVVALATAAIPEHKITASWRGLLDFLYLPEWLLLTLLLWLVVAGAGAYSFDVSLRKTVEKRLGIDASKNSAEPKTN
ncbi:MAG TPA: DoxX family protein [Polyangium sp.]|nr:DoxX family protein [Polyangium sp.]